MRNFSIKKILYKEKKWIQVIVLTAIPLSPSIEEYLLLDLKNNNKNIKYFIENKVNNKIIGGLSLYIEDKEWNNSFKESLKKLRFNCNNYI